MPKQQPARKMEGRAIASLIGGIARAVGTSLPSVSRIARRRRDPFRILVSTILSLRTKDQVTLRASERLFAIADTPAKLAAVRERTIENAIYPVGFYKTKARTLKDIARRLGKEYAGKVPDTLDGLLTFKGIGRKTANLVLTLGYGKDAICVDTHVHRIPNRLGLVETQTPVATEFALMEVLPRKYWIGFNALLVSFGQRVCKPVSPLCSKCPLEKRCPKIGVERHR